MSELETFLQQMDNQMINYYSTTVEPVYTTPTTTTTITYDTNTYVSAIERDLRRMIEGLSITYDNSARDYVMYTGFEGYQNMMSVLRRSYDIGSQLSYRNYTVSEACNKNQTELVITTKSGYKMSKTINNNLLEKERLNLSKGRVSGYKHIGRLYK